MKVQTSTSHWSEDSYHSLWIYCVRRFSTLCSRGTLGFSWHVRLTMCLPSANIFSTRKETAKGHDQVYIHVTHKSIQFTQSHAGKVYLLFQHLLQQTSACDVPCQVTPIKRVDVGWSLWSKIPGTNAITNVATSLCHLHTTHTCVPVFKKHRPTNRENQKHAITINYISQYGPTCTYQLE